MIILYGTPLSSYTAKVRMALEYKGIPYSEREPVGGYRSADWRAIIPTGTIPAIDDQGFILGESEAILEYLEERFPEPSMLPGDAAHRARIRGLARLHDLHLEPKVRALFPLVRDPEAARHLPERLAALGAQIDILCRMARPGPFLAGPSPTMADCGFAVSLPLARMILAALGHELRWPELLANWLAAVQREPALAKALEPWHDATLHWLRNARPPS